MNCYIDCLRIRNHRKEKSYHRDEKSEGTYECGDPDHSRGGCVRVENEYEHNERDFICLTNHGAYHAFETRVCG